MASTGCSRSLRVFITGGTGFIGSHLVEHLLARGAHVTVLDDLSTGPAANVPCHPRAEFIDGSVMDPATFRRAAAADGECWRAGGLTVNVGSSRPTPTAVLSRIVLEETGSTSAVQNVDYQAGIPWAPRCARAGARHAPVRAAGGRVDWPDVRTIVRGVVTLGEARVHTEAEFLILGGGIAGLAAAAELGNRAVVVEREARPGGLVRTECFDGYWFDHVLHLLHVPDDGTQRRMEDLLGDMLAPCPPVAWIETAAGTVRYPFQLNLGGLDRETAVRCLADYARACFAPPDPSPPADFESLLRRTFGAAICEIFLLPYNRKVWRRPLDSLAPSGFVWNVARPSFEDALRGGLEPNVAREAYNSRAFYPRPPAGAPLRGMEVLSQALAAQTACLHLETVVERIDPATRTVAARRGGERVEYRFVEECLCTLPLPTAIRLCAGVPDDLRRKADSLLHNVVFTAAFSIRGPRPDAPGQWRYHADESVPFTRLVYMTELDPLAAPPEGWGVMAEITHPAEAPRPAREEILAAAREGLRQVGALPAGCEIVGEHLMVADPAYVVFTPESQDVVHRCRAFLEQAGISTVGRYGRWEYSSMAQVMNDAFGWARPRSAAGGAA